MNCQAIERCHQTLPPDHCPSPATHRVTIQIQIQDEDVAPIILPSMVHDRCGAHAKLLAGWYRHARGLPPLTCIVERIP